MKKKCRICHDKAKEADGQCPVCCDFGLIEPIANSVVFPNLHHSDLDKGTVDSRTRQILEYLIGENHSLRKERDALLEREDRLWGLLLALCSPNEMDEINKLFVEFISGPWRH